MKSFQRKLTGFGFSILGLAMLAGNAWADVIPDDLPDASIWALVVAGGAAVLGVKMVRQHRK